MRSSFPSLGVVLAGVCSVNHLISEEVRTFIIDCRARKLSLKTIQFYSLELEYFQRYLTSVQVVHVQDVTANLIREYLVDLGTHRNPGGVHAGFRAIKVFLNWYSKEEDWVSPIRKVQPPKLSTEPLAGVPAESVQLMLATCDKSPLGLRDRALLLFLLDTGVRRGECVALNIGDVNLNDGSVFVRHGKGDKPRTVYIGLKCRRELSRYLRNHDLSPAAPLWLSNKGTRLTALGLRQVIRRRANLANVPVPEVHDFRRSFALSMLRNGCDVFSLMRLMGHTSPTVLNRYLKILDGDLQVVHARSSPADNL
jgi:site-specific recombinase XerD